MIVIPSEVEEACVWVSNHTETWHPSQTQPAPHWQFKARNARSLDSARDDGGWI